MRDFCLGLGWKMPRALLETENKRYR